MPRTQANFGLMAATGLGLGVVGGYFWLQYAADERKRVHHRAHGWREEV